MDLHPQFFDRYETLLLEPFVGHTGLGGQSPGHRPRAVSIQTRADGGTKGGWVGMGRVRLAILQT
jgi:hypothetical protein